MDTKKPFWLAIKILFVECILLAAIMPGDWAQRVAVQELDLFLTRLGEEEHFWIMSKSERWYQYTLIDTGIHKVLSGAFMPSQEAIGRTDGMEGLNRTWRLIAENRITAITSVYYYMLNRIALLYLWLPYMAILIIPATFNGITVWRIKRTNFQTASQTLHHYGTNLLNILVFVTFSLLLAPIILDPVIIPIMFVSVAILVGVILGNTQKRI